MTNDEASAPEGRLPFPFDAIVKELCDPAAMERAAAEHDAAAPPIMVMVQQRKLQALFLCYDRAMEDKNVRLPAFLHGAIAELRK